MATLNGLNARPAINSADAPNHCLTELRCAEVALDFMFMTCVPTCYGMRIFRIFKHYTDGKGVYLTPD